MNYNFYKLIGTTYEGLKIKRINNSINAAKMDGKGITEFILVELEDGNWVRYYLEDLWKNK